jgi:hypothetical protein
VDDAVYDAVAGAVRDAVGGAVGAAVHDAVDRAVGDAVHVAVGGAVGDAVHVAVHVAVRDAVRDAVDRAVRDAVRDAVDRAVRDAVGVAVDAAVRGAVGGAVHDAVDDAVGNAVNDAVRGAVRDEVHDAVRDAVGDAVGNAVDDAVAGAVNDAVRDAVAGAVRDAVRDEVGGAVRSVINNLWRHRLGGQFWVGGWYWGSPSYVSYFREVCHLDLGDEMNSRAISYAATCEAACWWWPHRDFVMVCERPVRLERDAQGRLHSLAGQAIEWPDGWGLYRVHGVTVPSFVVEHPEEITVARIDAEANAEVRRIMIERYGAGRYMRDAGAQRVHGDPTGVLYARRHADGTSSMAVHVLNSTPEADGSRREFWLRVHPELRPLLGAGRLGEPQALTARNAVASTFGLRGEAYAPVQES